MRQVIFVLDTIFCIWLTSFIDWNFLSYRVVYVRCISVSYCYRYCICCAVCIGDCHSYRLIFSLCGDISRNCNRLYFILRRICCYCCCNFVCSCSLAIWLIHSAALCCIFLGICTSIYHIYFYFHFIFGSVRISNYNGSCGFSRCTGVYRSFPVICCALRQVIFILDTCFCIWLTSFIDRYLLTYQCIFVFCFSVGNGNCGFFFASICIGDFYCYCLVRTVRTWLRNGSFNCLLLYFVCRNRNFLTTFGFRHSNCIQNCLFLSFCSVILVDSAPVCIVFIFIRYAKRKRITHNGMLPIWTIGNQNYFCAVRYCICTNINREITGDEVGKRNGRCTIHGICIGIGSFIICLQFHRHVACGSIRNLKQFTCIGRICNQRLRNSTCNSYIL